MTGIGFSDVFVILPRGDKITGKQKEETSSEELSDIVIQGSE